MKKFLGKLTLFSVTAVFLCGTSAAVRPSAVHAAETVFLDKPALELSVGESELVGATGSVVWSSEDESVATVSQSGVVKGVGVGETAVIATGGGGSTRLPVYVIEEERGFDDNILISVFWPPTAEYMNAGNGDERWDEQFRLMSEAGVDYLCNVTGRDRQQNIGSTPKQENTKETNLKMAMYAHKYGMRMTVADERFGAALLGRSAEQIGNIISEYRNVPGVGGYYILDEPVDPMPYVQAYEAIKLADPSGYAHLNFLPLNYYKVNMAPAAALEHYKQLAGRWLQANADAGFPQDYLMYDLYPFRYTETTYDLFYENLDAFREVGLEYDVKTACYLQSNRADMQDSGDHATRLPTPAELRYEIMVSLAYGYKQLSYFTWFQPTNRNGENFYESIVDADGQPHPVSYPAVKQLNAEIHNLGKTLVHADSMEVHLNGKQYGGQTAVPDDFVFGPMDEAEYTVSLMKDKRDGRNYVMLVNNNFQAPVQTSVFLSDAIGSLWRISPEDGKQTEQAVPDDRVLNISLEAGDAVLYALPEGLDFTEPQTVDRTEADAVLARAESEGASLGEEARAALDEAVEELRNALGNEFCTQAHIDSLTDRVAKLLAEGAKQEEPEKSKRGCRAALGGSLGGAAASIVLAAALLCLLKRRVKK